MIFNKLSLRDDTQEVMPYFWIRRNADGHLACTVNYRLMTHHTIDLIAYNFQRTRQKLPPVETIQEYWEIIAEEYGGFDSPLFQEEFENSFEAAYQELKAFHSFRDHNTKFYEPPVIGRDVHISMDFGWYHPCCVIAQSEDIHGRLRMHFHEVKRGYKETNKNFIKRMQEYIGMKYAHSKQYWYRVQEGNTPNAAGIADEDGNLSPAETMSSLGIMAEWKYSRIENRVNHINEVLSRSHNGLAILNFNPENEDLITCMDGGYRREWTQKWNLPVPTVTFIKDGINDHVADALAPIILVRYPEETELSKQDVEEYNPGRFDSYR